MKLFRRGSEDGDSGRWMIAGLGNPGARYAGTRHNLGAMVIEQLLEQSGSSLKRHKSGCMIAETELGGERVVLARPLSYMNESGRPLRDLARWYKIPVDRVVVVHDEFDLPFGDVRVKVGGGLAGHNGLRSIVNHFGTKDFARVRIGISKPPGRKQGTDHVLDEFDSRERRDLPEVIDRAAHAVERILEAGLERAMNEVNTRSTGLD
jgi:peptidyl-tRNA hydrolase, PTH1 family